MATIGQTITTVDPGWKRIDDTDPNIYYTGEGWIDASTAFTPRNGASTHAHTAPTVSNSIQFKFTGSKLRLYGAGYGGMATGNVIIVDGVPYTMALWNQGTTNAIFLSFDKSDFSTGDHYARIVHNGSTRIYLDAIDIDENGSILKYNDNPGPSVNIDISQLSVGDKIPCRYTAIAAGVAGVFSELGTCSAPEISTTGVAAPDGKFNFIKADKGLLIADRVVQTGISWDTLNTVGYVEGKGTVLFDSPTMTSAVFPYGKVTCSTYHTGAYPYDGWRCFNPNPKNQGDSWQVKGSDPCWLAYDWTEPKLVNSYGFTPNSLDPASVTCAPKTFRFEGSADSTNWVVLDRRVDETSWVMNQFKYFTFTNDIPYRYYRLYIESNNGGGFTVVFQFCMGIRKVCKIRSLTGGNAYLGTDGKASFVDKGLGAWPPNNEWDRYIVKSDLGGKIVAGDDAVWHRNINAGFARTWCSDTMINGIVTSAGTAGPGLRVYRAYFDNNPNSMACFPSGSIDSRFGFRPVLEYPEDPRCTNIWY
jgi:hypothetical protein